MAQPAGPESGFGRAAQRTHSQPGIFERHLTEVRHASFRPVPPTFVGAAMTAIAPLSNRRGSDYATLLKTVRAQGLLDRRLLSYGIRAALTLGFYGASIFAVVWVGNSWFQLVVAGVFGLAYGQVAFLGHDAGHQAIFASRRVNDVLGRGLGILDGLSFGW